MAGTQELSENVRHTVVLDEVLLKEAQRVLGTPSIRATIERSLRETVRRQRLKDAAAALGTFEMAYSGDEYIARKRDEASEHLPEKDRRVDRKRGRHGQPN